MNKKHLRLAVISCAFAGVLWSCNNPSGSSSNEVDDSTETVTENEISVTPINHSKDFPGAELTIASIDTEKVDDDSVKVTVKYGISNFELTEQTEDDHAHHLANSHDGQHIHFILDNKPYDALYKPEHSVVLPVNSEHYLLSFLSRSYHESIKTPEASKLVKFKITENGEIENLPTPTEASLFYSRPKGEYIGEDTKNLLLDFFLVNTNISTDGNKILAEVNGKEFTLDSWQPYEITGAPMGELTVKLTLIDNEGNAITGDNVSIERKVQLKDE